MDLHFSEEDERFRHEVLEFIKEALPADWKGTGLLSEAKGEEEWRFAREMLRKVGAKGWHSLAWPKEHGGQESMTKQFIFSEEMYYHELPGVDLVGTLMLAPALIQHAQRNRNNAICPGLPEGRSSGARVTANRGRALTWPHYQHGPQRKETSSLSTDRRPGVPTPTALIGVTCWCGLTLKPPSIRESASCSWI